MSRQVFGEQMRFDFIMAKLKFPSFVIQNHSLRRGVLICIQQGCKQPVTFAVAGTIFVIEAVFDDADDDAARVVTFVFGGRVYFGQERSIG